MDNNHTDELNYVDETYGCYKYLNVEEQKKLLLILKQENNQLKKKLNILEKAIYVTNDTNISHERHENLISFK